MNINERRRFFRLNSKISYAFFIQSPLERLSDETIRERLSIKDSHDYRLIRSKFKQIDKEMSEIKSKINHETPHFATYLDGLNKKIVYLAKKAFKLNTANKPRPVNLSLRGIAFYHDEMIPKDEKLHFRLDLPTAKDPIVLSGRIIYCYKPLESDEINVEDIEPSLLENAANYRIAAKFLNVPEDKEQLIHRYLLSLQSKE